MRRAKQRTKLFLQTAVCWLKNATSEGRVPGTTSSLAAPCTIWLGQEIAGEESLLWLGKASRLLPVPTHSATLHAPLEL
jgi:hypothetical protein